MNFSRACLLFSCPDRSGIIAEVARFFSDRNINILTLEQHSEDEFFFVRIEWDNIENIFSDTEFEKAFSSVTKKFGGQFRMHFFSQKQTLGLFVSKEPHALLEILAKYEMNEFPNLEISFLVSNDKNSEVFATRYGIPFFYISTNNRASFDYEEEQLKVIKKFNPQYIGLARYMKILSADFIEKASCPIINIHHSFLPAFVGANPYEMAYTKGVKLVGATSHFVIPELDQGPIIDQDVTRVLSGDSVEKFKCMGRDTEKRVFAQALKKVLEHKVIVYKGRTIIFE
ncbi:formyltetrahydrofolate deformylase [Candidatus Gracilibacteria bacterium]|nr:formyltetrahydrofolate deformylase [Candidatus Gracilibacteria bacterium]